MVNDLPPPTVESSPPLKRGPGRPRLHPEPPTPEQLSYGSRDGIWSLKRQRQVERRAKEAGLDIPAYLALRDQKREIIALEKVQRLKHARHVNKQSSLAAAARRQEAQYKTAPSYSAIDPHLTLMGDDREMSTEDIQRTELSMQLSAIGEEFVKLRALGRTPLQAVEEMDRQRGVSRSEVAKKSAAKALEDDTQIHQLKAMGIDHMTDPQFRAWKNNLMITIAQHPGPNAGASLRALELIEKQRWNEKFGTKEMMEKTLKECDERLAELDALEAWGLARGKAPVEGGGGDGHIEGTLARPLGED